MKGRLWNTLRVVFILSKRSSWLLALPIKQNNHQYETTVVTSLPRHHILLLCLRRCIHLFLISLINLSVTWPVLLWSGHMKFSSFVQIVIGKQLILFPRISLEAGNSLSLAVTAVVGQHSLLLTGPTRHVNKDSVMLCCYVTLWRHRFCNVARSEILAWNSFIVRCHVTSK